MDEPMIDRAARQALQDLARVEVMRVALTQIQRLARIGTMRTTDEEPYIQAAAVLRGRLLDMRNEASRAAMMFGFMTRNEELRRDVVNETMAFLARDHQAIMQYLSPHRPIPGSYYEHEEQQFRSEIRDALAVLLNVTPGALKS